MTIILTGTSSDDQDIVDVYYFTGTTKVELSTLINHPEVHVQENGGYTTAMSFAYEGDLHIADLVFNGTIQTSTDIREQLEQLRSHWS